MSRGLDRSSRQHGAVISPAQAADFVRDASRQFWAQGALREVTVSGRPVTLRHGLGRPWVGALCVGGDVRVTPRYEARAATRATEIVLAPEAGWEMIDAQTLSADAPQITFSGLDGARDQRYRIEFAGATGTPGVQDLISVRVNGTASITVNGQLVYHHYTAGPTRAVYTTALGLYRLDAANAAPWVTAAGELDARVTGQNRLWMAESVGHDATAANYARHETHAAEWQDTTTNVTSLVLGVVDSGGAWVTGNRLLSGASAQLYRRRPLSGTALVWVF